LNSVHASTRSRALGDPQAHLTRFRSAIVFVFPTIVTCVAATLQWKVVWPCVLLLVLVWLAFILLFVLSTWPMRSCVIDRQASTIEFFVGRERVLGVAIAEVSGLRIERHVWRGKSTLTVFDVYVLYRGGHFRVLCNALEPDRNKVINSLEAELPQLEVQQT